MKKLHSIFALCTVLALLITCAVFTVSADTTVTPSNETFTTVSTCPHCGNVVSWTPLTAIVSDIVTKSGHYVVESGTTLTFSQTSAIGEGASDVAILVAGDIAYSGSGQLRIGNQGKTTTWLIGGGGTISGGHAPDKAVNPSLIGLYDNGTLNIIGNITIKGNETEAVTANRGGVINVYNKGKVNMYGGTVTGFNLADTNTGSYAGVYLRNGGSFTMYGGTINGGSSASGPAVYVANGTFTMEGGTVNGGDATASGGTICIADGTVNINGNARVNGGTTGKSGGIFYQKGGNVTISGNAVLAGTSANYGGVAYIEKDGTFQISGNAQLTGAAVNNSGGTLYCNGTLNIGGGTLTGGTAVTGGGNIGTNGGTIHISGGTLTGGEASIGGNIYLISGELNMTGGTVTGGTARNDGSGSGTGHGGCIYVKAGSATFRGGTLSGGKTIRAKDSNNKNQGGNGGTIYAGGTVNLSGTTVNGGTCYIGGAFYVPSGGIVNMTAGTVTGGTASSQGQVAGVYSGTFNMTGGTIHNTVLGESGIRVQGSAKVYLHGNALIKAGAGSRDAFDFVGTSSTPATVVLAGNAKVGDLDGKQTTNHNMLFQSYTSGSTTYYPRLRIANDWTGYAAFSDNFGSTATGANIMAVPTEAPTKFYAQCGTWDAEALTFTQGGTYDGANLIHGSADEGDLPVFGENGNLMLPRAKAVDAAGTLTWHRLGSLAIAAAEGGYTVLYTDDATPISIAAGQTAFIDFNGFTASVTGAGTLKGFDSSALTTGTGTSAIVFEGVTVDTVTVSPVAGETFIAIKDGSTATFHAVTANITAVNLRPGNAGMYYTAQFVCDDAVKEYLDSFGLALSLKDLPGKNFSDDPSVLYTAATGDQLTGGEFNSVLVQDVMKDSLASGTNKSRGEMPVYANAYLKLTVDGQPVTVLAQQDARFSLKTLLQEINTYWDTFSDSDQTAMATQIYDKFVRSFETDDWKIYNLRIKANGGYTPEEQAVLDARRQTVMDYMRQSVSLLWRSDKTMTYGLGNTQRDNGASFTIEEGRLYKGLPYVYGAGTRDSFLEYAGEPDENGIYTITGLEATALNYESYGGRVGNDCSGAVTNAWSLISPSLSGSTSSQCAPYFGVVPVGNYQFNSPINPDTHRILDTAYVVNSNGEQVMYEAYAMLQPADAAYHQEYPSTKGNHIRMVVSVNVVRNPDGTIDGTASTITMLEQTRTQINANKTEVHPVTGETVYVIGGVDKKYTFSKLFSEHYIPVTVAELRDPSALEEVWVSDTLEEATVENLFTGSIITNYNLDAVQITVYNQHNEIVQQTTGRKHRSYPKEYKMERFLTEKPGSMKGTLDLDALEAGNYRCTVTVKLTMDDDYIHTARDFTFSK